MRSPAPTEAITLRPCDVAGQPAECGTLSVPENRATREGRYIDVEVVVLRARGPEPAPDPIVWLAGGPGGSAIADAADAHGLLNRANVDRDLVFMDQRGTGASKLLICPHGMDVGAWSDDLSDCLAHLDADPAAYTTAWAMDDLDDVRAALGYETVNVYGGSYGATAAQVYLQRHPERVRTVTMLGGSLLEVPMFERYPTSSQGSLDQIFALCAADPACRAAFPDPAGDLRAVIARLDEGPVDLPLRDPVTGRVVRLSRAEFGPGLHNLLRDARTAVVLPHLLHAAARGDWGPVADIMAASLSPGEPTWVVMGLTIMCYEPWAAVREEATQAAGAGSYMSYADVRALTVSTDYCEKVPHPLPQALYWSPVTLDVPTLLINGALDPQDPPANVAGVLGRYPRSLAVTAPMQAHVFTNGACLSAVITDFVATASTEELPITCLTDEPAPVFALA